MMMAKLSGALVAAVERVTVSVQGEGLGVGGGVWGQGWVLGIKVRGLG